MLMRALFISVGAVGQRPKRASSPASPGNFAVPTLRRTRPKLAVPEVTNREQRERKATKSDDAEIPEYLWTEHLLADAAPEFGWEEIEWNATALGHLTVLMNGLRSLALRWWKRRLLRSFNRWIENNSPPQPLAYKPTGVLWNGDTFIWASSTSRRRYKEWQHWRRRIHPRSFIVGNDAIARAAHSSWWSWEQGSTPFFWRWPLEYQVRIRDGVPIKFIGTPPHNMKPQRGATNESVRTQMIAKLSNFISRAYIGEGVIKSLTSFFAVPKGDTDIRMVFDGTASGLNDVLWVPGFGLPTVQTHLRAVDENTYMADVDIGEMFLNFHLHSSVQPFAGIDITRFSDQKIPGPKWRVWKRCAMGLTSSPYLACQAMGFAEEVIRGDRTKPSNIFRWTRVHLNLPGSKHYDPSRPWVSKIRDNDPLKLAADVFIFVDDLRPCGGSKADAWQAARRAASVLNWLGIQDAPRKRRDSSQSPGAWTGAVIRTDGKSVSLLVSQDKWDKAKSLVHETEMLLVKEPQRLPRHRLEEIRGFLNYVCQTYNMMVPHLIGYHMTIDSWRPNRDKEGWRQPSTMAYRHDGSLDEGSHSGEAPAYVQAVPRLKDDVRALKELMITTSPPLKRVRCKRQGHVYYGFGDASGAGFGASFQIGEEIHFEYGQWAHEVTEKESSNWRELNNLVEALTNILAANDLNGSELFLFTDNSTAESAFWKGSSKSKKLFELVLSLKKLELKHELILHVLHVSGRRMIEQGTDGLSRADHSQGVMRGKEMREFIPLHLSAIERSEPVQGWLSDVTRGLNFKFLKPNGWYEEGQKRGNFIWTPPPAAADVVMEQIALARHKRPECMHIVVVPRLMTGRWRRLMIRRLDGYARLAAANVWPLDSQFEPLLVFIALPYHSWEPLHSERQELLERFQRIMLGQGVQEVFGRRRRNLLRELFRDARSLCPV